MEARVWPQAAEKQSGASGLTLSVTDVGRYRSVPTASCFFFNENATHNADPHDTDAKQCVDAIFLPRTGQPDVVHVISLEHNTCWPLQFHFTTWLYSRPLPWAQAGTSFLACHQPFDFRQGRPCCDSELAVSSTHTALRRLF